MTALLHYEDLVAGAVIDLGRYTPSKAETIAFAAEFDPQPFHLDEAAAKASLLGGLCTSGWHTCAIIMRMTVDGFLSRAASMGSNGLDEVKWLKPVYADEALACGFTILEKRVSAKRPEMGIVKFRAGLSNLAGELKCEMAGVYFIKVRAP